MIKYIDVHTHPLKKYYENENTIQEWIDSNLLEFVFFVGADYDELDEIKNAQLKHPNFIYKIVGIHPSVTFDLNELDEVEKYVDENTIAIGEVGLDYYYENNPSREIQIAAFEKQIGWAKKNNIPVMVHSRDVFDDIYEVISKDEYNNIKFIFHTWSGDVAQAIRFLELGNTYFSFSGTLTFKKNQYLRDALEIIPLNKIFSETDSPYLSPEPVRGKQNNSINVQYVVAKIAEIKKVSVEEMTKIIRLNVKEVFNV